MTSDTNSLNDEIDIRELIQTLFRYKWIILCITILVAAVVLVFSKFFSPKSYAAQVQVIFTKPLSTTNLETSIQSTPQTPEAAVLRELSLDNDLLWKVYLSEPVSTVLNDQVGFEDFKSGMSSRLTGTSKLYLIVVSSKPETAAVIANVWASQFISQTNSLFSFNEKTVALLSNEVQDARQKMNNAEQALMDKLPDGMADTRKIELTNAQNLLSTYLNTITQLDLIVKDAQGLQSRLNIWPDDSKLSIEYQISLVNIYQRAATGLAASQTPGIQSVPGVQVQIAAPSVENARTVAEAKSSLDALISSLGSEIQQLQAGLDPLRQDITAATLAYEAANYQLTQLTAERDLALNAYQVLSAQLEETRIDLAREDVVAKLVGQALAPETPVSNRTLMKTLIAGVLAFVLSCFGVLFIHWWKSSAPAKAAGSR